MPFSSLGLEPRISQAVREAGYTEPTPIQSAAIPVVLAGHDLIGIAQTGTGKTAAFTLPMLTRLAKEQPAGARGIRALIIGPTRELVVQTEENVRAYAKHLPLRVVSIYGGVSERPQIKALRESVDIVIATPGRLLDLMKQRHGNFSTLETLVLDEADRLLDMGFLPDIRSIVKALPQRRQTLLFSATFPKEIEALTHQFQQAPKTVQIGRRANPAETVTQLVYEVPHHLKMNLLLHLLTNEELNMVLLFSRTKHGADKIARKIEQAGIRTATLHSNRSQNQRLRALNAFKNGSVRVLVATDIAARGIDVDAISHVVNYDFPMHPEDYVHRIGRTGRAHAVGEAISFAAPDDQGALRALEKFINRGLVRKKADGFDYHAAGQSAAAEPRRFPAPARGKPNHQRPARSSFTPAQPRSHPTRSAPRQGQPESNRSRFEVNQSRGQTGGRRSPMPPSRPNRSFESNAAPHPMDPSKPSPSFWHRRLS